MNTILSEFKASLENIKNNFYFSFLSINFLQNGPFASDITLQEQMKNNIMSFTSLNNFGLSEVNEYKNSIRRHCLNDIVIAYERYSMLMYASHKNNKTRTDPATINDRKLGAAKFEQLKNIYIKNDVDFLIQLRRLRNSIVHYNGVYTITNPLNYTFDNETYNSQGNAGNTISVQFDTIMWIYNKLLDTVERGNTSYFNHY